MILTFLVSVFTAGSVAGYIAEMLWCMMTHQVIESRQGMVFGPFSQVYGIAAVLLTLIISKNSSRTKIFLISAAVGGIYEYACSYIQERLFGTVSWDYGNSFLSIGGRTSLIFCLFWGTMGVFLIKYLNPALSSVLSRVRGEKMTVISAVVTVFFILNLQLSFMAVKRQTGRRMNVPAVTEIDKWLDLRFNDDVLKRIYPNMVVVEAKAVKNKNKDKAKEAFNRSENPEEAKEVVRSFVSKDNVMTDPMGSWTGSPADLSDVPTQDADDL